MRDGETGEIKSSDHDSIAEGLSGIDLKLEGGNLRIDGMMSSFVEGKVTRKEPLEPIANYHIRSTLKDARYIAEKIEERDLKRTIFVKHSGTLYGVDSAARVQLVRDKEWSPEEFKWHVDWVEDSLKSMRKDEKEPNTWSLSIVDEE